MACIARRAEELVDPRESILEKWLLHEACEAYSYWSCVETDPRIRAIWEQMLDYERGARLAFERTGATTSIAT